MLLVQLVVLNATIIGARLYMRSLPDRTELGLRRSALKYEPVQLGRSSFSPYRLAGAWTARSSDPRFGGFSGLEMDRGKLLAIGDSGSVAWLDKPDAQQSSVLITDLPGGPGDRRYKKFRDAEAVRADPAARGWWVPFERANQLWLYDRSFSKPLRRVDFGMYQWPINGGAEGLVTDKAGILLFVEDGTRIYRLRGSALTRVKTSGEQGMFSEAVRLPDGRVLALERTLGWRGFHNALALVVETDRGYRLRKRVHLPLGPFDNMEGMVAETMPNGTTRLWIIADDNFERPMRTLLIALDLPPAGEQR